MANQDQYIRQDVVAQQDFEVLGNTQLGNDASDVTAVVGKMTIGGTTVQPVSATDYGPGPLTDEVIFSFDGSVYDAAQVTVAVVDDANNDIYVATYNIAHNGTTAAASGGFAVDLWGGTDPTFNANYNAGTVEFRMSLADAVSVSVAVDAKMFASQTSEFITITSQPSNESVTAPAAAQFVVAATTNDGGTLSYQWEEDNGGGFAPLANAGVYSGVDTDTLDISDSTGLNGYQYQCVVSSDGGAADATTTAATLTVA